MFEVEMRNTEADAILYEQRQRSLPTGNYTGRLSVRHPRPLPKLKFRETAGQESRASSDL